MVSQPYNPDGNFGILCVDGDYTIQFGFEEAFLAWEGGAVDIGDHYGHPTCAVMDVEQGWCVTGGAGLVINLFERGFPKGTDPVGAYPFTSRDLWNPNNPPPDGRQNWFVYGLWFHSSEQDEKGGLTRALVHALVEPGSAHAGLYEVELLTLKWRRL